jgi:hypothetical protein
MADDAGVFTFIPNAPLSIGVYEVIARATDTHGAMSEPTEPLTLIVEEPGFIRLGSLVVSVLSVIVPLVALTLLLLFGTSYLWHRLVDWRRGVIRETKEAESELRAEFRAIVVNLNAKVAELRTSRGGKLTKAEQSLITQIEDDLKAAEAHISKEISDIDDIVQ